MALTSKIKRDSPITQILRLFVIPIFAACTLCVISFILLHKFYAQNITNTSNQFLLSYFEQLALNDEKNAFTDAGFQKHANIILQTGVFEGLSLLNHQKDPISHAGLPHVKYRYQWVVNDTLKRTHKNHTHSAMSILLPSGNRYWLVATVNDTAQNLLFSQILLWGLIVTLILGFVVVSLALRSYHQFVTPINQLTAELKSAANGNFHQRLTQPKTSLYLDLVNKAQHLLEINKGLKEGMHKHTEQATKELRESLETVEIQNIELDLARKNAIKISENKSELLANTSHEIRTPLNGILGFTHLLLKTPLNDQQKDYLATIEQSAQGLLTVINDIIDYSRLETGVMSFEYKPVNIRSLISEVLQIYAPSANESHLKLIQLIDPKIPPTLLGDPLRLKQVVNNLIHCVIALAPSGNLIIESRLKEKNDSKWVLCFTIKNPTTTISGPNKQQLQAALNQQKHLQIGDAASIGLAIAKALTERMQGTIVIEEHDETLSFTFTVELGQAQSHEAQHLPFNADKIKALVFDDNPWSCREITEKLESWEIKSAVMSPRKWANDNSSKINAQIDWIQDNQINLAIIDCITDGRRFNTETLAQLVKILLQAPQLHIAIIAASNIRRQLEKNSDWGGAVNFITRPLLNEPIIQLLQKVAGLPNEPAIKINNPPLTILIADDNPANLKLVCAFLDAPHHKLITAQNGQEAIEAFKTYEPDIIFMDVQMPTIDGLKATQAIRQLENTKKRTPIIALTANAMPEQRSRILMAGMDDYLTKPVSDEDLNNALKRWQQQTPTLIESSKNSATTSIQTEIKTKNTINKIFSLNESLALTKNNPTLAKDMLLMQLNELPECIHDIQTALKKNDFKTLLDVIHKLRGGCAYTGLLDLRAQCIETDNALQSVVSALDSSQSQKVKDLLLSIERAIDFTQSIDLDALFTTDEQ